MSQRDWRTLLGPPFVPGARGMPAEAAPRDPLTPFRRVHPPIDALDRQPAFAVGLDLYAAGYFWEAHEVLEPLWLALPPESAERHAVQAVIQIANACLKLSMDRPSAALRVVALAEAHLQRASDLATATLGFNVRDIAAACTTFRQAIDAGSVADALHARPKLGARAFDDPARGCR